VELDVRTQVLTWLWYQAGYLGWIGAPLSWVYSGLARTRRQLFRIGLLRSSRLPVPVIVIGNIAAGGTGKTPLTIWLAHYLLAQGYSPGIVCSGYGGLASTWPQQVRPDSDPTMVGDEPVLIAQQTRCPVVAGRDRVGAAKALLAHKGSDVLLCDDGLQHYRLARDLEIVVIDGARRHGNGLCFPFGPLREPRQRAQRADWIVTNGVPRAGEIGMDLVPSELRRVDGQGKPKSLRALREHRVHAVAGIGNPERFFELLRNLGYTLTTHSFPDHHPFSLENLTFTDGDPVIMTEKDAVKCRAFALNNWWYLRVKGRPQDALGIALLRRLADVKMAMPATTNDS
jgi:tetraacyldisaccharide 4'-kinase